MFFCRVYSTGAYGGVSLAPGVTLFRPGEVKLTPEEQRVSLTISVANQFSYQLILIMTFLVHDLAFQISKLLNHYQKCLLFTSKMYLNHKILKSIKKLAVPKLFNMTKKS